MKLIITSSTDIAGKNMYNLFRGDFGFQEESEFDGHKTYKKDDFLLIHTKQEVLDIEYLNEFFQPEIYICCSRHSGKEGKATLTAHSTGNWAEAGMGGEDRELIECPALYLRKAINILKKNQVEGFEVVLEVTHHGPSKMNAPLMFIEVGSTEEQWNNQEACRAVCKAALSLEEIEEVPTGIGFGGTHYADNFTKIDFGKYAIGHICPGHFVDAIDEEMVKQAIEKTIPTPSLAVLDWKGLYALQREKLIKIFENIGIEWKKVKELRKEVTL